MIHVAMKAIPKDQKEAIFPDITPGFKELQLEEAAFLEAGMESGSTSVMLKLVNADGSSAIVQTSAKILLALAEGCRGAMLRFGDHGI